MRPYQASLVCNVADSELLVLTRVDFYRTFKHSTESWRMAEKHAKDKEQQYISRCQSYLHFTKKIINESNAEVKKRDYTTVAGERQPSEVEVKHQLTERRYQALLDRDNKQVVLERFNTRSKQKLMKTSQEKNDEEFEAPNLNDPELIA